MGATMLLLVLAYLGGVLTIVSPCILPVLPFVFARADRPFARSGLPMLIGMALTFAAVATLAAVGGPWALQLNQRSEEHTSELQSLMRNSYAVFCLKKNTYITVYQYIPA